jgi:hypothetical protein
MSAEDAAPKAEIKTSAPEPLVWPQVGSDEPSRCAQR